MFLTQFLYSQLFITPPPPTTSFTSKTVIVTGANTGLGLEAARHITRLDAHLVILACRNTTKGEAARESILASTGRTDGECVQVWHLDLSSVASVVEFARRVERELERLDVLVESAGVMNSEFRAARETGLEEGVQVNVISTFLLALLLLPKLRGTGERFGVRTNLAVVTSELHHVNEVREADGGGGGGEGVQDLYEGFKRDGDGTGKKKKFNAHDRYSLTKSLEVLFVRALTSRAGSKSIHPSPVITLVNPGLCSTEFMRNIDTPLQTAFQTIFLFLLGRTAEVGGRTLVAGACATERAHGRYMADGVDQEVASWVRSERGQKVQSLVFEQTMKILEELQPGISKNI